MTKFDLLSHNYQEIFSPSPEYFTIPPQLLTVSFVPKEGVLGCACLYKEAHNFHVIKTLRSAVTQHLASDGSLIFPSLYRFFNKQKSLTLTSEAVVLLSTIPVVDCKNPPVPASCIPPLQYAFERWSLFLYPLNLGRPWGHA